MTDLLNTLETPGEFDALVKLRPDEPYFLLIGRDRLAPALVDDWADKNRRRALAERDDGKLTGEKLELELRQSTQAEMIGCAMRAYKAGVPLDPEVERREAPAFAGHHIPEDTAARDREQRVRARAVSVMNNAIAELVEQGEVLREIGFIGDVDPIAHVIEQLRQIVAVTTPKRPMEMAA